MKINIFTLKKEYQGLKPGFKVTLDEEQMDNFEEKKIISFYSGSQEKRISIDLSDSDLFEQKIGERTSLTVKDLLEYLRNFNPETDVHLDHDGWLQDDIPHENVQELIERRGLFDKFEYEGKTYLTINN